MKFWEHFEELRKRLFKVFLSVILLALGAMIAVKIIWQVLLLPLPKDKTLTLINVAPMEALMMDLKVALFAGLILSFPIIVYQLYRFIAPGLYNNEKKMLWPLILSSTFFFLAGASFCFFVVLPMSFHFLQNYSAGVASQTWTQSNYLSFVIRLILAFATMFQLPVLSYFLAKLGLLTATFLISQFRIAIVIIFVVAAILTPPDVVSQLLLAIPLLILYGLSILVVRFVNPEEKNV